MQKEAIQNEQKQKQQPNPPSESNSQRLQVFELIDAGYKRQIFNVFIKKAQNYLSDEEQRLGNLKKHKVEYLEITIIRSS